MGDSCGSKLPAAAACPTGACPRTPASSGTQGLSRRATRDAMRDARRPRFTVVSGQLGSGRVPATGGPVDVPAAGGPAAVRGDLADEARRFVEGIASQLNLSGDLRDGALAALPRALARVARPSTAGAAASAAELLREAYELPPASALAALAAVRASRLGDAFGSVDTGELDAAWAALWEGWKLVATKRGARATGRVTGLVGAAQTQGQAQTIGAVSAGAGALFGQVMGAINARINADTAEAARQAGVEAARYQRQVDAAADLVTKVTRAAEAAGAAEGLATEARLLATAGNVPAAIEKLGAAIGRLGVAEGQRLVLPATAAPALREQLERMSERVKPIVTAAANEIIARGPPAAPPGETDAQRREREERERLERERLAREERERLAREGQGIPVPLIAAGLGALLLGVVGVGVAMMKVA